MRTTDFLKLLEEDLPLELAMPDDPVGLQVMAEDREVAVVGVAYEIDERVVEEASRRGVDLLVAFHPLIYPSLSAVTPNGRVGRVVIELVRRGIGLHIVHTAFDAHPRGTSRLLAEGLGLEKISPLVPSARLDGAGMGAVGDLSEPLAVEALAARLAEFTGAAVVRVSSPAGAIDGSRMLGRIAVLGGSGMSYYRHAIASGADAFITADVRYHGFHEANDAIVVLDPGHAESESAVVTGLASVLEATIKRNGLAIDLVAILLSTNPVNYICV
jgi:dinuclear metal center YbgI/SA1388 family protein